MFHFDEVVITSLQEEMMGQRLEKINRISGGSINQARLDIRKTRDDKHGDDLYRVAIKLDAGKTHYFAESQGASVEDSFFESYKDIARAVKRDRNKMRQLARTTQSYVKSWFQKRGK